ncbi:MAG TPA: hypothetical protein VGQ32_02920, partial [Thermoanaerobaculia bacterium]|nr:hypothetical protein [Thermoanaerobaculia bacterium]
HTTRTWDWFTEYKDLGDGFRADNGFVPQVGYRENYGEAGYTIRPENFPISRVRFFLQGDYQRDTNNDLISQSVSPGFGFDGMWNSNARFRYADDKVRSGGEVFPRKQLVYSFQVSPSYFLSGIVLSGTAGEQVDFDNHRPGTGADVNIQATLRPTNHLKLDFVGARSWVDVDPGDGGGSRRLFTADIGRIKATYTFTARAFLRLIGQLVQTTRDPSLYTFEVAPKDAVVSGSALFAYKVNWQTVLFLGYGDNRVLQEDDHYAKAGHQFFLKVSYAFQR